jgi:hypothetical protein
LDSGVKIISRGGLQYGIAPKVSDKAYANGYDLLVHAEESSTLEIVLLRERPA